MTWKISNFAQSTLRQSVLAASTTMYIDADEVDLLPTLGGGDFAKAVLFDTEYREIVNISAWNTDGTLTVVRAQEGTAARDWAAGTKFVHTPTAELLQNLINATTTSAFFGTATNVGNAYTVDLGGGSIPSLSNGDTVRFLLNLDSTGPATLVVTNGTTSTTVKAIEHQDGIALEDGDLQAGWMAEVVYSTAADAWMLTSMASHNLHAYQLNDGPVPAISRHRNGQLDYWRAGTSFATPASGSETADGWNESYDGTIGTFTVSRQAFTNGQTQVPGQPRYFLRWDHTSAGSGSTSRYLWSTLPGVEWREGASVTRSVWMKADTARSVTMRVRQYFGTGGAPSGTATSLSVVCNLTTSWQKFEVSGNMVSLSGKTIGTNNDDYVLLELQLPINVTMTIDVAMDDIRPGSIAGISSDTWPVPWWLGGTGGSYANLADFVADSALLTTGSFATSFPDLTAIEALATTGFSARTAGNTWALRSIAVGTGLTISNPAGVAGDPSIGLGTALTNYNTDPLSVAELASITAVFGTAAFVNTGTSGATLGLLNGAVTYSNTFTVDRAGTAVSQVTVGGANAQGALVSLLANAGQTRLVSFDTAATVRWRIGANNTAEGGANAGSDLVINAFNDAGSNIRSDLTLARASGSWTLAGVVLLPAGSVGAPSLAASADSNTGVKFPGSDVIDIVTAGAIRGTFNAAGQYAATGLASASTPEYCFLTDENCGVRRTGADAGALVSGGTDVVKWDSAGAKDASNNLWQVGGKHMIPLPSASWRAQTTNGPASYLTELVTNRQMVEGYTFDQSTAEYIQISFPMPKSWDEGTITARFRWTAPSGSGNVIWGIQGVACSDDDALDVAWGTAQTVTDTLTAVNDLMITSEVSAVTIAGSPAEGDLLWLRVYRDAAAGGDTFSADAVLVAVDLFISLNGANDA